MKPILVVIVLLVFSEVCYCQTAEEWLNQKEKQKEYLLRQISYLKMYSGYIQKGIDIAHDGLTTINSIKNGDFNLHNNFFARHNAVNPRIKQYGRIADIFSIQLMIVKQCSKANKQVKTGGSFTNDEINYVNRVFDNLLTDCATSMDYLITVVTSNSIGLTDDERINRIDQLYSSMCDKYSFQQCFCNDIAMLALQRGKELRNIQMSRSLYNLKP